MIAKPLKGTPVVFTVAPGEHNLLADRPGIIEGYRGNKLIVRCTEPGTIFHGNRYSTPLANVKRCRVFIAPARRTPGAYLVCLTTSRGSLTSAYKTRQFVDVTLEDTREAAITTARNLGAKRPTILRNSEIQ